MTRSQYEQRFKQNYKVTGRGLNTTTHFPCPFCAAPEWYSVRLGEFGVGEMAPHVCPECLRSARFIFTRDNDDGAQAELVQCGGDPAPAWMTPQIRREDEEPPAPPSAGHLRKPRARKQLGPGQPTRPKKLGRGSTGKRLRKGGS